MTGTYKNAWDRFIYKITSGRFILTVAAGACLVLIVVSATSILESMAEQLDMGHIILLITNILVILQSIFNSYFKKDLKPNGNDVGN